MSRSKSSLIKTHKLNEIFFDKKITPFPKKYSIYKKDPKTNRVHLIHFGDVHYQHYKDQTKVKKYAYLDHNDKERRKRYRQRAGNIRNGQGKLTVNDPLSANYYAYYYLW